MLIRLCGELSIKRRSPCGSGLARESGVTGSLFVTQTPLSRASPLPQKCLLRYPGSRGQSPERSPPPVASFVL
ncbi:hypothetical protein FIV38_21300 [Pseudomonas proteolytica]|nr:hypothetical protein F4W61_18780 [Pseudomonas proteolytica]TWR77725.1 hypothetical protein FIV38_21300 [Pseudomonas proteolytica]